MLSCLKIIITVFTQIRNKLYSANSSYEDQTQRPAKHSDTIAHTNALKRCPVLTQWQGHAVSLQEQSMRTSRDRSAQPRHRAV